MTNLPLIKALGHLDVAGRLLKWAVELSEFDVSFVPRHEVKSQVLADFVVECTGETEGQANPTWEVYVDGATSARGSGVGIVMIGPEKEKLHYSIHLGFEVSNNSAEYEALLIGMKLAEGAGLNHVNFYTDSQLVAQQICGEYEVREAKRLPYVREAQTRLAKFTTGKVCHVLRGQNEVADALSKLAKGGDLTEHQPITILEIPERSVEIPSEVSQVDEEEEWYSPIQTYLQQGKLPEDSQLARRIIRWSPEFSIREGQLLKKAYGTPWQVCLGKAKAEQMIREVHEGICGIHQGARTVALCLQKQYYWPTMRQDVEAVVRRCDKCQYHARMKKVPPTTLQTISNPWPFDIWGIDLLGPFPKGRGQVKFLIVAIEY